ncbi:DUF397 domain-containing protein [Streptomyces harbinensis]|uniref:DUF397 domain-containing protein n=1 Tax=Streptomyces harbinensis TaxID=1176198 RepID=UPI003717A529
MATFRYRRSSYSTGGDSGLCVEVATNIRTAVAVRDSKNPAGPVLLLTPAAWANFLNNHPLTER